MRWLQRALRMAAVLATVVVPLGLFYCGAQPVAVGLIPTPWEKFAHAEMFAILAATIAYASVLRLPIRACIKRWWDKKLVSHH